MEQTADSEKYPPTVREAIKEISDWIVDERLACKVDGSGVLFEDELDAIKFKLRWC